MSSNFSVTTSNNSFISSSSHCLVKHVIRSTTCSTSEIDSTAKESSMVTSSSSLSLSFRCSWSLWHSITVSMAFWRDSCRQAMLLTSIDGCDITTSRSKLMYSVAETSVESYLTKLSNSSFSAKSVNWTSGWLFWNPHFLKQLTIVSSETSPQADFIQEIAFKTSTSWIMSVAFTLSLILEITNFKSFLRYLSLKFLMIPASNGWSLEVVLFGKNTTFMLEYRSLKLRMSRCVIHKKYNFPLSNFYLSINFSQNWYHNFGSHPCFRTGVVINVMGSG